MSVQGQILEKMYWKKYNKDGTSVSSAFVTSAAALLKSRSPNIEAKEIKMILMTSVQKLDSLQGICSSEGCLNIAMALKLLEENI